MFRQFFAKYKLISLFILIGILLIVSFITIFRTSFKDTPSYKNFTAESNFVSIGHKKLKLLKAVTEEERKLGLSGRETLSPEEAMIFIFSYSDIYPFWMKDMKFPIDIFWIDGTGVIVFIKESASPESYPNTFVSNVPAKLVLETTSGFARKNNVKIGDKIYFSRILSN